MSTNLIDDWKDHAVFFLKQNTNAELSDILEFVIDYWQNLRSDEENLCEFNVQIENL